MAQTTLAVRIDKDIKQEFDNLCSEIGMSSGTAVNIFIKRVLKERKIPFELSADLMDEKMMVKSVRDDGKILSDR